MKQIFVQRIGGSRQSVLLLGGDQSNSTTTPTNVVGLSHLNLGAGTYVFEYWVRYQAAAATTGVKFSLNFTGTGSILGNMHGVDNTTAPTGAANQASNLATGAAYFAFSSRASNTTGWGTTVSVDTAGADCLMKIEGILTVTAVGNLNFYHGSEVAAASTTKAGSVSFITDCN